MMTVGTLVMTLVDHNLVTQRHTAHVLSSGSVGKCLHHQVILLRHHHEFHTFLPVAKTVEPEIVTDEITGRLIF